VRSVDDLTARARIRDAAVARFGRDGFGVGMRQIAADAGVSAALVVHHFGTKDALRAACDEHVHSVVRDEKQKAVRGAATDVIASLAQVEEHGPLVAYLVRSLLEGGEAAAAFADDLVADTLAYLDTAEEAGAVRPSRDRTGRARAVVAMQVGLLRLAQLDALVGRGPSPTQDPGAAMRALVDRALLPGMELYTHGLFADSSYLDAFLASRASSTDGDRTKEDV